MTTALLLQWELVEKTIAICIRLSDFKGVGEEENLTIQFKSNKMTVIKYWMTVIKYWKLHRIMRLYRPIWSLLTLASFILQ